jgi:hypothetical protein
MSMSGEAMIMSENNQDAANTKSTSIASSIAQLATAPPGSKLSKWQMIVRVIAISIPVIGAIPTARNIYYAWKYEIPIGEVSHRLAQYELWMKNVTCKIDYRSVSTARGLRIDVGGCPNTGDIAIRLSAPNNAVAYEWIAFDQLQKPGQKSAGLLSLLVPEAHAAIREALPSSASGVGAQPEPSPAAGLRVAQAAGMQVMCEAVESKNRIVRVVKDGNKCYKELVAPFAGRVVSRQEVPCTTTCTAK